MKEFYAKYLPDFLNSKPFKFSNKSKKYKKYRVFLHNKRGWCVYLGNDKSIKAKLMLCSSKYKKGDTVLFEDYNEKRNCYVKRTLYKKEKTNVPLLISRGIKNIIKPNWNSKENVSDCIYEDLIGISHFKVIAQISQFANFVEQFTEHNDENCFFDESDIRMIGEHRGAHDDGSYNICLIKCPTCEHFH